VTRVRIADFGDRMVAYDRDPFDPAAVELATANCDPNFQQHRWEVRTPDYSLYHSCPKKPEARKKLRDFARQAMSALATAGDPR